MEPGSTDELDELIVSCCHRRRVIAGFPEQRVIIQQFERRQ